MRQSHIDIRPCRLSDTQDLRCRILRPGKPTDTLHYPHDNLEDALHLGAWINDPGQEDRHRHPIGVVSVYPQAHERFPGDRVWRLRGMAVDTPYQNAGIGTMLVSASLRAVAGRAGRAVWCNARLSAMGFYEKLGFAQAGDPFAIEGIGEHVVMGRAVG